MLKIKKIWLFALFLALFPLFCARAEESSWYFGWHLLYDKQAVKQSAVADHCYPMNYGECNYDSRIQKDLCRLVEEKHLGKVDGRDLTFFKYSHEIVYSDQGAPWSCKTEEALITESVPQDATAQPVFADASEADFASIKDAEFFDNPKGPFLTVNYCADGTGGCSQLAFIRRDGKWQALEKDVTWDAVYNQVPGRYITHGSPPVDFNKLTWAQNLITDNDPNCCPSGRILFDLDIIDSKLSVRNFTIETGEKYLKTINSAKQ